MQELSFIGLFIAATMLFLAPLAAVEIEPGKSYSGGEFVEVKGAGVGFTVPAGWRGMLPENFDMFVMTPDNKAYIFVFARKMDKQEIKDLFKKTITLANGIILKPSAKPFISFREVSVPYQIEKSAIAMAGYGRAKQGPNGTVIGYIAAGPIVQGPSLAVMTRELARTTIFYDKSPGN